MRMKDHARKVVTYKAIGSRMRECREKLNLTQDEVAEKLNRPPTNVVSRWENGLAMPPVDDFPEIAKVLHTTVEYLVNGRTFPRDQIASVPSKPQTIELPYYGGVSAGLFSPTSDIEEKVEVSVELLKKVTDRSKCFVLKVNGDSMNRVIPSGFLVVIEPIDPTRYTISPSDILIVRNGGEYTLKRVRKTETTVVLESESFYSGFLSQVYDLENISDMEVIGRVVVAYQHFI